MEIQQNNFKHLIGTLRTVIEPYSLNDLFFLGCWFDGRFVMFQIEEDVISKLLGLDLLVKAIKETLIIELDAIIDEYNCLNNIERCNVYSLVAER